jgi:peptidyl-Asp metalloendopeptidase
MGDKRTGNFFKLFMVAVFIVGSTFQPGGVGAQTQEGLFVPSPLQGDLKSALDPTIIRARFVNINFPLLNAQTDSSTDKTISAKTLPLNLFPDLFYTAVLDRREITGKNLIWVGHLEGIAFSTVILVTEEGIMSGNISLPGGFYQVRYAGNGVHAVYQINQAAFPPEADPIPADIPPTESIEPISGSAPDDGSQIDILVVYTPAMRSAAGGTTAVNTLINLAVTETNTGYANSGVNQRLRLVHATEVSYTESGVYGTDLDRLTNPSDGYLDNVHTLRNTYGADLVQLLVESFSSSPGTCGVAWLMTTVSHAFEAKGFSVVRRECATGYYSFGHEFGHNMGSHHDWNTTSELGAYKYSKGYQDSLKQFRTVMAYDCAPTSCTRINYWSNPDVYYLGRPTGVIYTDPNVPADNRRSLNNTAYTVANFRSSVNPIGQKVYLPLILKASGPTPGYWKSSGGGTQFYVTPDQANVLKFQITVSLEGCGVYDIWKTSPVAITNNQFSFSGGLYASGTFDSTTAAHGTTGLNSIGPICGYYWTGGPWDWSATWQNSSQLDSLAADQNGWGFKKTGTKVPGTFNAGSIR